MRAIARLKFKFRYYRALSRDPEVPTISKWLLAAALAYLISPIDLVPDFIPVLGQLDDLVLVPTLLWLAVRFIPITVRERIEQDVLAR